jgi:hypothetical protein
LKNQIILVIIFPSNKKEDKMEEIVVIFVEILNG